MRLRHLPDFEDAYTGIVLAAPSLLYLKDEISSEHFDYEYAWKRNLLGDRKPHSGSRHVLDCARDFQAILKPYH